MAGKELLKWMHVIRRDLGNLVVHWTHKEYKDPLTEGPDVQATAFEVLCNILEERTLRGSTGFIRGGYACVCFTEAPVSELTTLFRISELSSEARPAYEPFGIAVNKVWLFERGGRPVIYQPDNEFDLLPDSLRWRHCRYEPDRDLEKAVDFTWEREWRIRTDALTLDPEEARHRSNSRTCSSNSSGMDGSIDGSLRSPRLVGWPQSTGVRHGRET